MRTQAEYARAAAGSPRATIHDRGELGADYVCSANRMATKAAGFTRVRERVAWWAELFSIPCVGYAASLAEAGELARAGARIRALADSIWNSSEGAGALAEAMERMRQREPVR